MATISQIKVGNTTYDIKDNSVTPVPISSGLCTIYITGNPCDSTYYKIGKIVIIQGCSVVHNIPWSSQSGIREYYDVAGMPFVAYNKYGVVGVARGMETDTVAIVSEDTATFRLVPTKDGSSGETVEFMLCYEADS